MEFFLSSRCLEGKAVLRSVQMGPRAQAVLLKASEMKMIQVATESEELEDDIQLILTSAVAKLHLGRDTVT